jgi:DNA polymerase III delta prime subunit
VKPQKEIVMDSTNELDILMEDINNQIEDAENISDKKVYQYIHWYDFLKTIKEKLENETYKLVFIGQKGIGKTTAILELFGLNKKINGKNGELLTTASGGTTTCEVELLKSEKMITYLKIEPVSVQLLNQYIDDFYAMHDDAENSGENAYLPTEIARSIRNMVGLKKKDVTELRKDCKDNGEFKEEITRRIDIQNRTRTVVECQSVNGSFFTDCQKIFNEINLCKNKKSPRQIRGVF